ncbi:hypothetical protein [Candidatus Roseilinea sp. NK_OTU-006]|jgi:hypothetical protein|uniref:hypothetical protein n=1 Tax=Candidatus Roseilinea sp. NK_OTU-006 TaxID=2704250 RepID=UPI00145E9D26|nr:hypothetical protein [Candidatus Roseilinea sp. NK_OTU-006]
MTLAQQLSHNTLNKIVQRFALREIGDPFITLTSPMGPQPIGACRLFASAPEMADGAERVRKVVYIGITVPPPIGLDSHMFFAFTPPTSAVPHFTLDSVMAGPSFAFHLDLIPRVDLGANLAYMNEVFVPLTPTFDQAKKIAGLTPAHLLPRQYALMSPWMLAYRATEDAYAQCAPHIEAYMQHWFSLVEHGIQTPITMTPAQLAERDRANRDAIFSYEVDPVWSQIERLIGKAMNLRLIEVLRNPQVETLA